MEYFKTTSLPLSLANEIGIFKGLTASSLPEFDALENATVVFSDQNSNETLQLNVPASYDITLVGVSSTVWMCSGWVSSATAPAFAD